MAAKFYDRIGFGVSQKTSPGVYEDVIIERPYYGDVLRNNRSLREGEKVNNDLSVGNSISIVADAYANENFHAMRYVRWMGSRWLISKVDVQAPRLVLSLGGVFNGPEPSEPSDPPGESGS